MSQANTLNALIKLKPFNELMAGIYVTVWIQRTTEGYTVQARSESTNNVVTLANVEAALLVTHLESLLGDVNMVDVQVGGTAYGITRTSMVGGTEFGMTGHARIHASARGEPTVVI